MTIQDTEMTDTRTTLLTEAEGLIRTRGYAGFSYADLSSIAGITKASIHHHFPTKEALAAAVIDGYASRYGEALEEIEEQHANALDRITAYGDLYLRGANQDFGCACGAIAVERDALPEGLRRSAARFFERHLEWLRGVYAMGRKNGEVDSRLSPPQAARMILSTLEGAITIERLLSGGKGFAETLSALRQSLEPRIPG